jgi:hypothetical protein
MMIACGVMQKPARFKIGRFRYWLPVRLLEFEQATIFGVQFNASYGSAYAIKYAISIIAVRIALSIGGSSRQVEKRVTRP